MNLLPVERFCHFVKVFNWSEVHFYRSNFLQNPYLNARNVIFMASHFFEKIKQQNYALFFYRSQNFLCQSKFFEPAQKFDCI